MTCYSRRLERICTYQKSQRMQEHEMKVNYNATGKERKRLAQAIGKAIGVDAIYKGVPTCAYEIGYFTVDREGTLIFDDAADIHEIEQVFDAIAAAGFLSSNTMNSAMRI